MSSTPDISSDSTAPQGGLRSRSLRAASWSVAGHLATQAIRLVGSLVMTRLLVPEVFGVVAMAMTFLFALAMLSDFGVRQAVVQHPNPEDGEFRATVFSMQAIRGAVICGLAMAAAFLIGLGAREGFFPAGSTYAHPELPLALALMAVTPLLGGLESIRVHMAYRGMLLGRLTSVELCSQVGGLGTTVACALYSPTILAPTSGAIVAALIRTAMTHTVLQGHRDRFGWSSNCFLAIFKFSRWVMLGSVLGFLLSSSDRLLLGALLNVRDFGVYVIAVMLFSAAADLGQRVVTSVIYPALNEIHRRSAVELRTAFYRFRRYVDVAASLAAGLLFVFAPTIIQTLYDPRYALAGDLLRWFSLTLLLLGPNASGTLYMIVGKPWLDSGLITVRLVALFAFVPLFTSTHGLVGAAVGVVASHAATLPFAYYINRREGLLIMQRDLPILTLFGVGFGLSLMLI